MELLIVALVAWGVVATLGWIVIANCLAQTKNDMRRIATDYREALDNCWTLNRRIIADYRELAEKRNDECGKLNK